MSKSKELPPSSTGERRDRPIDVIGIHPDAATRSGIQRHVLKLSDYEINTLAAGIDQLLKMHERDQETRLDSREIHTLGAIRTRLK